MSRDGDDPERPGGTGKPSPWGRPRDPKASAGWREGSASKPRPGSPWKPAPERGGEGAKGARPERGEPARTPERGARRERDAEPPASPRTGAWPREPSAPSSWRGPDTRGANPAETRPPRGRGGAAGPQPPHAERRGTPERHAPAAAEARAVREPEQKICGLNAARAAFAARPQALRKVYLSESRIGALREVLAFCVAKRLGYRVVEDEELERISGSSHHEGVCLLLQPPAALDLEGLLAALPRSGPVRLLWLDGVGNPHNLGAVLRSAAHFGAQAVLLPPQSTLSLSAAAARVAEGGAEHVPVVRLDGHGSSAELRALEQLVEAGFVTVATLPAGATDLYAQPLPQRAVFVLGAEGEGMQKRLVEHCERAVSIPGSGRVESLNIANAVAVLLAEHWRQHPPR